MDAGVPIKKPVAGIAMGLVEYENDIAVLTDIQGVEDHLGDMDFKVTGTRDGLTALQMDIKIEHVTVEVLSRALTQARKARLHILEIMDATISETRSELSENAPRLTTLHIPIDKIGALIGPGGKVIRGICERTGVKIDVQDDGTVFVASTDGEKAQLAIDEIRGITATPEMGATYNGKVVRVTDFGAFIEILPNQDGMVHISELDLGRVDRVEDVCNVGDTLKVKVVNIDAGGRVRLSRKAVLIDEGGVAPEGEEGGYGGGGGGYGGGGGRDRDRDRGPRGGGDRDRGPRGGGRDRDRGPRGGGDRDRGPRGGGDRDRGPRSGDRDRAPRERTGESEERTSSGYGFREKKRED
jgi:polyribonucleotide nucleotidyltransferase